jgi:MFS family permease
LSSKEEDDIFVLARLTSENHDLIAPDRKKRNFVHAFLLWWMSWCIPGMGMFAEAYILFAIGNIKPLLKIMYPNCWGSARPADCNTKAVEEIETIEICGIVCGMLIIGFMADWMGRKWGSRVCTVIMTVGCIFLTSVAGSAEAFLAVLATGLFVFGLGVGGEYPLASSSAAERAEGNPELRKKRGQTIALTFTQQGWGNWSNTLVILILLACVGATGTNPTPDEASTVVHVQFAVGLFIILCLLVYRFTKLEESKVWAAERAGVDRELEDEGEKENTKKLYIVVFRRNWSRLFQTCFAWFLNDFVFYGNKLFQSTFINVITGGNSTVFKNIQWTLLNSTVALAGYFTAAFMVDRPWYGRKLTQLVGFGMLGILFLMCGVFYNTLVTDQIHVFQFLYFFSSYWGQFGPNSTTWLVPGEVFPTDVRAFFHGISAAVGKIGAIVAAQVFSSVSTQATFYASAGCGFFGMALTWLFLPDTTGLDLSEIDRHNRYLLAGRGEEYHGEAVNPRHLSVWEKIMGWHKSYDPVLDEEQLIIQRAAKGCKDGDISPRHHLDNIQE